MASERMDQAYSFGDQMTGNKLAATAGLKNVEKPPELNHPPCGTYNGLGIEHLTSKADGYGQCHADDCGMK
jgi:hypothetical protein